LGSASSFKFHQNKVSMSINRLIYTMASV